MTSTPFVHVDRWGVVVIDAGNGMIRLGPREALNLSIQLVSAAIQAFGVLKDRESK